MSEYIKCDGCKKTIGYEPYYEITARGPITVADFRCEQHLCVPCRDTAITAATKLEVDLSE